MRTRGATSPRWLSLGLALLGLVLGLMLGLLPTVGGGCRRVSKQKAETGPKVDRQLMACLGALRAYHRQADVHLDRGDTQAAIQSVEQILGTACIDRKNPEVQEAVLDAYGRLGRLHMRLGQLDLADKRVAQGLERPGRPSFFRANLYMVRGDLLDARAEALDKQGKAKEANALRRQAITAFERSATMNRQLLERLVR